MTDPIARLLASDPGNPGTLPDDAFLEWLRARFCDGLRDEAFRIRLDIRSIWLANPELLAARERLDAVERAHRGTPEHEALEATARALHGAEQAVEGLTLAIIESRSDDEAKLEHFERQVEVLRAELASQLAEAPLHQEAAAARQAVEALVSRTGLDAKRAALRDLERARGRGTRRAGRRFEDLGAATIESRLFPVLRAEGHDPRLLRGVTLGCARGEWDGLVVEAAATDPAIVLGMVEFKRNPGDIAHGFALRTENLAWLAGDDRAYDPAQYRTQRYATGHFEGPVVEAGLVFTHESFAAIGRSASDRLASLHFVTTDRPLNGLSSREQHRFLNRIAGDLTVDWGDPAHVSQVRGWLDPEALRTAEVLERYADAGLRANVAFTLSDSG